MTKSVAAKILALAAITVMMLIIIWFFAPLLEINDIAPFSSINARLLLSLSLAVMLVLIYLVELLIASRLHQRMQGHDAAQREYRNYQQLHKQKQRDILWQLKSLFPLWKQQSWQQFFCRPLYLLVGEQQSGKTTLLNNIGLTFQAENFLAATTLKGSMANYHLGLSHEAVFVDACPPSDVTEQKHNISGYKGADPVWTALGKFIRYRRWLRPCDGIIVTLDATKLMQPHYKKQSLAMAQCLAELNSKLYCRPPIYLIVTKCDLLAGFNDFFADVTKHAEQLLTIIFDTAETKNYQAKADYFSAKFDEIAKRLNENLFINLANALASEHKRNISYFPQQFQLLKPALIQYLESFSMLPIHSMSFCSCKSGGEIHDFLMADVAKLFAMPLPKVNTRVYASASLFAEKIYTQLIAANPVQHKYVSLWVNVAKNTRLTCFIGVTLLFFSWLGLTISNNRNNDFLQLMEDTLPEFKQLTASAIVSKQRLQAIFPVINAVQHIDNSYAKAKAKWLMHFEIFIPLAIASSVKKLKQNLIKVLVLPGIANEFAFILTDQHSNNELRYLTLKGYLALQGEKGTTSSWIITPQLTTLAMRDNLPALMQFLKQEITLARPHLPIDKKLVADIQQQLRNAPLAELAYYELKQQGIADFSAIDIANASRAQQLFISNHRIPGFYTYQWFKYFNGHGSHQLQQPLADIVRVLHNPALTFTAAAERDLLTQLWQRYTQDYRWHWHTALTKLQLIPFKDLATAVNTLALLTSPHSPLKNLLAMVQVNTSFLSQQKVIATHDFISLNALLLAKHQQQGSYSAIVQQLYALHSYLKAIANAPNSLQAQFDAAKAYFLGADNPIYQLKLLASKMPYPVNSWLDGIANNCLKLLLVGAKQVINTTWQTKVWPFYQRELDGKYPFAEKAREEASIKKFADFFANNGIATLFIKNYVQPFINTSNSPWQAYTVGSASIGIAADSLAQVEKIKQLNDIFFSDANKSPSVTFNIQALYLDSNASSINLQFANQTFGYRHGPLQLMTVHWELSTEAQQASYSITDFVGRSFSRTCNGPWAWLRLMMDTEQQPEQKSGRYLWKINNAQHQAQFDVWQPGNPCLFKQPKPFSIRLPREL